MAQIMSLAPSETSKRVHKPAEKRRADILRVATRIFAERGYKVADMQAVADAAGVGKGTVYRYFPTKETLFVETLKYNLDRLKDDIRKARSKTEDPLEQLKAAMVAYVSFFERNPLLIELFIQERAEFRREAQSSLYFSYMMEGKEEWAELFRQISEKYPLRDIDLQEIMCTCGDLLHGAMALSCSPLERKPLTERIDALLDIYLYGILGR